MEEIITDDQYFLVDVEVQPSKSIQVFIDGDNGISISQCAKYGRALINQIDEDEEMERNEIIEVSSPGLDQPIVNPRQYIRNINRYFEFKLSDASVIEGKLTQFENELLTLKEEVKEKGKKTTFKESQINLSDIIEAKVVVKF